MPLPRSAILAASASLLVLLAVHQPAASAQSRSVVPRQGSPVHLVAAETEGTVLYVTRRESVSIQEFLDALAELGAMSVTALEDGVVRLVFAPGVGSESELREKVARSFGVAGVTDVDLSSISASSTQPVTVPGLDEDPVKPSSSLPAGDETAGTNQSMAWWLLVSLGVLATLAGGVVLLADVRRRLRRDAGTEVFRHEPDLGDLSEDLSDAPAGLTSDEDRTS